MIVGFSKGRLGVVTRNEKHIGAPDLAGTNRIFAIEVETALEDIAIMWIDPAKAGISQIANRAVPAASLRRIKRHFNRKHITSDRRAAS